MNMLRLCFVLGFVVLAWPADRMTAQTARSYAPSFALLRDTLYLLDSTYLNYWMPFDGGIGFHGLEARSYYQYLGRRRSSHGCVRIANETGAALFKSTPTGTLVYVHSGAPARVLRFADSAMTKLQVMDQIDYSLLASRLDAVVARRWQDSSLVARLALPARKRISGKMGVGRIDPTAMIQKNIPLIILPVLPAQIDHPVKPIPVLSLTLEATPDQE